MKRLRCIHRHTFEEHPNCFFNGKIKLRIDNAEVKIKKNGEIIIKPWWADPRIKVGYFDIEVTNLKANFGFVLTWALKELDGKVHYDVVTRDEVLSDEEDKRIVNSFLEKIKEFDLLVGYYSKRFDIPYIRTRALYHNLDVTPLEYRETYHWDLYDTVKRKLQLSRNTLEVATRFLGIEGEHGGKNHVEPIIWKRASKGNEEALKYVLDHNIRDVEILELLHKRLWNFSSNPKSSI